MGCRSFANNCIVSALITVVVIGGIGLVDAQVMGSTNYQLQSDSLNFGGGRSTSTNYTQESTFGEVATGISTSTNYNLYAGYQQMQTSFISLTGSENITLSPTIGGVTGGESNGSTTVTVITDNPAGYQLTLTSSDNPAMQSDTDSISDYEASGDSDFSFLYGSAEAVFGFTPEGVDVVGAFLDDTSTCGTGGSIDTPLACWGGLSSTTATVIASDGSANHPGGATTSIRFRVGIGVAVNQAPGVYTATTTVTAIAL